MPTRSRRFLLATPLLAAVAVGLAIPTPVFAQPAPLELVFTYGSEKKEWLEAVTADYAKTNPKTSDGRPVKVVLIAMGSGESMEAVREPVKWEAAAEAEIKRAGDEVKRAAADVEAATAAARERPTDPALAKRKADAEKREADAKKAEKKAKETKLAARAHLTSPASRAFIRIANYECKKAGEKNIVDPGKEEDSLVKSAVVIAIWEDMARALGWPNRDIGWADLYAVAEDPKGWSGKFPGRGWGRFKFGHTHPELSNSGLLAVLAEAYYAADKVEGLTLQDLAKPQVRQRMMEIEKSVLFYGQSTGFFKDTMVSGGPDLISAGILYEDQIIKANDPKNKLPQKLVAIYPAEGTFLSDHPVALVERNWVTDAHKDAAKAYLDFLLQRPQQVRAMEFGFRPGIKLPLDPKKFNTDLRVDPKQPRANPLDVPSAEVMEGVINLWKQVRKPVRVALVLDTSKSMVAPDKLKLAAAKAAAAAFVNKLDPRDELTLLAFNSPPHEWSIDKPLKMTAAGKMKAMGIINGLRADYQTGLYDAVSEAFDQIKAEKRRDFTTAVVVLSDGEDYGENLLVARAGSPLPLSVDPDPNAPSGRRMLPGDVPVMKNGKQMKLGSTISFEQLIDKIQFDPEGAATRVFTIAYGADADPDTLGKISTRTRAVMYPSTPGDIDRVIELIRRDQ